MRRAAIEDASVKMLEVFERVSAEAKKEKNASPPVNRLVYYWTRKPLVVGRAVALASTLESPEDVESLLGFSRDKRAYQLTPNLKDYRELLGKDPSGDYNAGSLCRNGKPCSSISSSWDLT